MILHLAHIYSFFLVYVFLLDQFAQVIQMSFVRGHWTDASVAGGASAVLQYWDVSSRLYVCLTTVDVGVIAPPFVLRD